MAASNTSSIIQRFGSFEVDPRSRELCREGIRIRMQDQPLEVLLLLLARKGEVVTRDELKDRLWPVGTFVDADDGLNTAIRKLREVLGDSAECPLYIETIPRRGYRFIGPVEENSSRPIATPPAIALSSDRVANRGKTVPAGVRASRARTLPLLQLLVVAVGLASAVWYLRRPLPPPHISANTQITFDGLGKSLGGTDGTRLYFCLDGGGIRHVSLSGGSSEPIPIDLPNPAFAEATALSPDGSSMLVGSFEWNDKDGVSIARLPGGSVHDLTDEDVVSATWSPDGASVAYSTADGDVKIVRSDGTGVRTLARVGGRRVRRLSWSPDGRTIRFFKDWRLWEMSSNGSNPHELLHNWRPSYGSCCGQWTPDGQFYVFLAGEGPPGNQIWALDERRGLFRRRAAEPVQLSSGPMNWGSPLPSKDGKKIFSSGFIDRGELVRFDSKSGHFEPFLKGISAEFVDFSRDGKSVVYVSAPEGILWRAMLDGSKPVQLTEPPIHPLQPRWSPDGSKILFMAYPALPRAGSLADTTDGPLRSYVVSSMGGSPRLLLPEEEKGPEDNPNWSPDGRKVAFSNRQSVRNLKPQSIRILDVASHQVSALPGSERFWNPRWSPNGRFMSAESDDAPTQDAPFFSFHSLKIFDLVTERAWVLQLGIVASNHVWSRDGRFIYFESWHNPPGVFRIPVKGGEPELVVDLQDFHPWGTVYFWMGLDPTDKPLMLRYTGSDDIYALTLEEK